MRKSKNDLLSLIAAVALLTAAGAASAEWTKVSNSGAGADDFTGYVDVARIARNGDLAKMFDLRDYRQPQTLKATGRAYLSKQVNVEYNCKEEQMRWLELIHYAGAMGKGEVIFSDDKPRKWIKVNTGTVAETRWKIACGKKQKSRDTVALAAGDEMQTILLAAGVEMAPRSGREVAKI